MQNIFFYIAGIIFLILSKSKSILKDGYSTPKPFDISETDRCLEYNIQVVEQWLFYLQT